MKSNRGMLNCHSSIPWFLDSSIPRFPPEWNFPRNCHHWVKSLLFCPHLLSDERYYVCAVQFPVVLNSLKTNYVTVIHTIFFYFRLVQHEYDNQEACEDNPQADLVDHIRNEMARKPISVKHENLMSVKVG